MIDTPTAMLHFKNYKCGQSFGRETKGRELFKACFKVMHPVAFSSDQLINELKKTLTQLTMLLFILSTSVDPNGLSSGYHAVIP